MKWLTSPLAATVVVCAVLAALAIPLRRLTTDRVAVEAPVAAVMAAGDRDQQGHGHVHGFSGVLRVRLLEPAASLRVAATGGAVLWDAGALEAGEHAVDAELRLIDDALELHVEADFGDAAGDTALFLTVLPDGVEEQTHYAIGSGRIDEILFYEWDLH